MATVYEISSIKKLIDLNGSSTNFVMQIKIVSENQEPFEMAIVKQKDLEKDQQIPYKESQNGEVNVTFNNTDNVFSTYYLILKSAKPCKCMVDIVKEELPISTSVEKSRTPTSSTSSTSQTAHKSSQYTIYISGIALLVLIICGYLYVKSLKDNTNHSISSPSPQVETRQMTNQMLESLHKFI